MLKDSSLKTLNLRDIEHRADLLLIMRHFYDMMLADDELAPIFTDVANIHLEEHLPVLVDFWEGILYGGDRYRKNAMVIHLELHRKHALTGRHFQLWLKYFNSAVDSSFRGEKCELMKTRALSIATVMQIRIAQSDKPSSSN